MDAPVAMPNISPAHSRVQLFARANIAVACAVLAMKIGAYMLTGSVALLSDALESGVNVITAVVALVAVEMARRPADRTHQFGHHKAEYIAAVIDGALILAAAALILNSAVQALWLGQTFTPRRDGLALSLLASGLNAAWAAVLVKQGRTFKSPALVADGKHLWTDVATSVAVVVGLALALFTGALWLDAALAAVVAVYILWEGFRLLTASFSGLMDEAVTAEVQREMRAIIADNAEGAIEAHDIRTRVAGRATFIVFHLVVPGWWSVSRAHTICDRLEAAIATAIPGAVVTIHVEPEAEVKAGGDAVKL